MQKIVYVVLAILLTGLVSCESAEEISRGYDHEVPVCQSLTLKVNSETKVIDDNIVSQLLWGVIPQTNLETIVLPTVTASPGSTVELSIEISDNVAVKTAELSYSSWLYSKYINFANPVDDIPLTPERYTFVASITVPANAVTTPWIETYNFNDGSTMKYIQSYHKLTLTVVDVNMNSRSIPVFIRVE